MVCFCPVKTLPMRRFLAGSSEGTTIYIYLAEAQRVGILFIPEWGHYVRLHPHRVSVSLKACISWNNRNRNILMYSSSWSCNLIWKTTKWTVRGGKKEQSEREVWEKHSEARHIKDKGEWGRKVPTFLRKTFLNPKVAKKKTLRFWRFTYTSKYVQAVNILKVNILRWS